MVFQLLSGTTSLFTIRELGQTLLDRDYQRGSARIIQNGDNVGLAEIGSSNGVILVAPTFYGDWEDETGTPYPTKEDLLDALASRIFSGVDAIQFEEELLLFGSSSADSQEPVGLDIPLKVEFGVAQKSASDPVMLAADGTVTWNQAGRYTIRIAIIYGRLGSVGASDLRFRDVLNGSLSGEPSAALLDNADVALPFGITFNINRSAGDSEHLEIMRDSSGEDAGGLFRRDTILDGFEDASCAVIAITRLKIK